MHKYFFKFLYAAPNSVTGKIVSSWTGRIVITAPDYSIACNSIDDTIKNDYPKASNIRNVNRVW